MPTPAILTGAVVSAFRSDEGIFLNVEHAGQNYRFGPARSKSANEAGLSQAILSAQMSKAIESYIHETSDEYDYCVGTGDEFAANYTLSDGTFAASIAAGYLSGVPVPTNRVLTASGVRKGSQLRMSGQNLTPGAEGMTSELQAELRRFVTYAINGTPEMPKMRIFLDDTEIHRTRAVKVHTTEEGDLVSLDGVAHKVTTIALHPNSTVQVTFSPYADGSAPKWVVFEGFNERVSLIARTDSEGYADKLATLPATGSTLDGAPTHNDRKVTINWANDGKQFVYRVGSSDRVQTQMMMVQELRKGDYVFFAPGASSGTDEMIQIASKRGECIVEGEIVSIHEDYDDDFEVLMVKDGARGVEVGVRVYKFIEMRISRPAS